MRNIIKIIYFSIICFILNLFVGFEKANEKGAIYNEKVNIELKQLKEKSIVYYILCITIAVVAVTYWFVIGIVSK